MKIHRQSKYLCKYSQNTIIQFNKVWIFLDWFIDFILTNDILINFTSLFSPKRFMESDAWNLVSYIEILKTHKIVQNLIVFNNLDLEVLLKYMIYWRNTQERKINRKYWYIIQYSSILWYEFSCRTGTY